MQRWAAIAAMAQTWAGSTVTPIACARTFNEILNDLYCAFYTVAADGPAPELPTVSDLVANGNGDGTFDASWSTDGVGSEYSIDGGPWVDVGAATSLDDEPV